MTDEDILNFTLVNNPNATQKDVESFRRLMFVFDCEDSETPAEAHERIATSMSLLCDEVGHAESQEEQGRIVREKLHRMRLFV